ncbi:MAG: chemotaxis protein CheA [Spirochaetota bacterium]|nr:chemotaxis protein CheA [Spirochaetota bacterium]
MSDYLDPNNEELLKDFFIEAESQVDALEQNILVLENDPGERDAIDEIFRAAHTLKGAAATVQMTNLAEFTHLVEDVLDAIRSSEISADEHAVDVLLNSIDVIKEMLETKRDGGEFDADISDLKDQLSGLLSNAGPAGGQKAGGQKQGKDKTGKQKSAEAATRPKSSEAGKTGGKSGGFLSEYDVLELNDAAGPGEQVYQIKVEFNEDHPMNSIGGVQVFAALRDVGTVLKTDPEFEQLYEDQFFPVVCYYVSTAESMDTINNKLAMPDVVLSASISAIEDLAGEGAEAEKLAKKAVKKTGTAAAGKTSAMKETPRKTAESEASGTAAADTAEAEETESAEEEKAGGKAPRKEFDLRKGNIGGSVLRVDSKRIDNLLNLVSEAVITKATFNQISSKFNAAQAEMNSSRTAYYESLHELFDSLPVYLERIQNGEQVKKIKTEIIERFGNMYSLFESFESQFKNTVNEFTSTAQNLSRNTSDLQEGVMQIRMVPISQIFNRFPRLVRDVSKDVGKKVRLEISGEETELDKSVIEDLLDPLIHCVRNAIDHGIEAPDDREAAGKSPEGHVHLRASNEGNMIIIEVEDDGKGIDIDTIHQKAIDRGLIHPSKKLSEIEAFNLIFEPGFSTASKITNLSGRGVGLDVVKKQIEKLNGNVSVWSQKNVGSRITIKIPLTLAIIQGLLIRVGREIYAIPITSVVDSHRINSSDINMIDTYEVFNVREDVVSLIRLNRLFGIPTDENKDTHYVVIVGTGDKKMGLMIDSLIGEEDVVIKPLKDKYTNTPGIAGATILGDGTVALIIDVSQLLDLGLRREMENRRHRATQIT